MNKKEQLSIEEAARKFALEIYKYPNDEYGTFPSSLQQSIMIGFTEGISWRDNNPSGEKMYTKEEVEDLCRKAHDNAVNNRLKLNQWLEQNIINP